eukprot:scaffold49330_cov50-Prasinocladus_malaysianus.AAC.2
MQCIDFDGSLTLLPEPGRGRKSEDTVRGQLDQSGACPSGGRSQTSWIRPQCECWRQSRGGGVGSGLSRGEVQRVLEAGKPGHILPTGAESHHIAFSQQNQSKQDFIDIVQHYLHKVVLWKFPSYQMVNGYVVSMPLTQAVDEDRWVAAGVFDGHGQNGLLVSSAVMDLFEDSLQELERDKPLNGDPSALMKRIYRKDTRVIYRVQ